MSTNEHPVGGVGRGAPGVVDRPRGPEQAPGERQRPPAPPPAQQEVAVRVTLGVPSRGEVASHAHLAAASRHPLVRGEPPPLPGQPGRPVVDEASPPGQAAGALLRAYRVAGPRQEPVAPRATDATPPATHLLPTAVPPAPRALSAGGPGLFPREGKGAPGERWGARSGASEEPADDAPAPGEEAPEAAATDPRWRTLVRRLERDAGDRRRR